MFQIERLGGRFVLAAMAVPEDRFEAVTALVNAFPEVAHNYRREHRSTCGSCSPPRPPRASPTRSGASRRPPACRCLPFPSEREYFVDMKLRHDDPPPDDLDRRLIVATQAGLPLVSRPYDVLANSSASAPAKSCAPRRMLDNGRIRRIGAVPNHYAIGYTANGMSVWDVPDERIDELGEAVGALPFVTHCYERPRALPDWPYNLFAMVHGQTARKLAQVEEIAALLGTPAHDILYSTAILKKTGLRIAG
jgi:DNA-binding Lrp family transcriptional regulator